MASTEHKIDVTVRGAGVFGLSIAYACAQRGARVRVVEPNGVAAGSSGGIVGALAPHTPDTWNTKKQFQFESLIMAQGFWDGVEALSGLPTGYGRTGRLQPVLDAHGLELARARQETAKDLWQGHAEWSVQEVSGAWAPHSLTDLVIFDTLSGRIHPRQATTSLAAAVTALGGHIVPEAEDAGVVVWATGYEGLVEMNAHLPRYIGNGVKGQAALLKYDAPEAPQLFADGLHIIPHADGTVAIGSTTERYFDDILPDALLEDVLERAFAAFPILQGAEVLERWAGVRPRSRTRAPMLGYHPLQSGAFVANGGFKVGFGMAPLVGEVMADLILDGVDRIPDGFEVAANL